MNTKQLAAEKAVEFIQDGMVVGLGTGSTAFFAIQKIGERVKGGLKIRAIASSKASEDLARKLNIPIVETGHEVPIDVAIDGADEVDDHSNLIKGGGGALLREKILASNSKEFYVIVDESKLVHHLGMFRLPVEIISFSSALTLKKIQHLGGQPEIRKKDGQIFITDNGNLIADCSFYPIENPADLNEKLKLITGVVETGLFLSELVTAVIVGYSNGEIRVINR